MSQSKEQIVHEAGKCPVCHQKLTFVQGNEYACSSCHQHYLEQAFCNKCSALLQMVKGCGSINYICAVDGLVSSSKVQFHYELIK